MPQMLIRDIEPEMMERLKALAKLHNRSLQKEVKETLLDGMDARERKLHQKQALESLAKLQADLLKKRKGKPFPDSTELIRKSREQWI